MKIAHMLLAVTAVMVALAACGTTNEAFIERPESQFSTASQNENNPDEPISLIAFDQLIPNGTDYYALTHKVFPAASVPPNEATILAVATNNSHIKIIGSGQLAQKLAGRNTPSVKDIAAILRSCGGTIGGQKSFMGMSSSNAGRDKSISSGPVFGSRPDSAIQAVVPDGKDILRAVDALTKSHDTVS